MSVLPERGAGQLPGARGPLTLLDDLLRLLPDAGVAQEPPLSLLADLALQVVLFWDLSGINICTTGNNSNRQKSRITLATHTLTHTHQAEP